MNKPFTRIKVYKDYCVPEYSYDPDSKFSWEPIKPIGSVCHSVAQAKEVIENYLEGFEFEIIPYP